MAKTSLDSALIDELYEIKEELEKVEGEFYNSEGEIRKEQKKIEDAQKRIVELQKKGEQLEEIRAKFDQKLNESDLSEKLRKLFAIQIVRDLVKPKKEETPAKKPTKAEIKVFYETTLANGKEKTLEELKAAFKAAGWEGGLRPDLYNGVEKNKNGKFSLK
jgi:hypothetical protein